MAAGSSWTLDDCTDGGPGAVATLSLPQICGGLETSEGLAMAQEILIVDDEPDIRMLIEGILRGRGLRRPPGRRLRRGHRRLPDAPPLAGDPRHLAARLKLDGLGILQGAAHGGAACPRRDDLRPRHHRDRGFRDPARRLRLHREAVQVGPPAADRPPGAGGGAAGARERRAAAARRRRLEADRGTAPHRRPPRLHRAGGADRLARADHGPAGSPARRSRRAWCTRGPAGPTGRSSR